MKTKHFSLVFVGILLAISFTSCGGPEQKVQSKLETIIDAANDGDYDCCRRYCRGFLRDFDLKSRYDIFLKLAALSKMAVGEGVAESADDYINEQMEEVYSEGNIQSVILFKEFKQEGEVEGFPGHGEEYKIIKGSGDDGTVHFTIVFAEYEDDWYPVSIYSTDEDNTEDVYNRLKSYPKDGKLNDKSIYDIDTELTAEFLYKYAVKNHL